jgi:hypothetical protein
MDLGVIGIIGIILLIGIVKKNGIMLVDFAISHATWTTSDTRASRSVISSVAATSTFCRRLAISWSASSAVSGPALNSQNPTDYGPDLDCPRKILGYQTPRELHLRHSGKKYNKRKGKNVSDAAFCGDNGRSLIDVDAVRNAAERDPLRSPLFTRRRRIGSSAAVASARRGQCGFSTPMDLMPSGSHHRAAE